MSFVVGLTTCCKGTTQGLLSNVLLSNVLLREEKEVLLQPPGVEALFVLVCEGAQVPEFMRVEELALEGVCLHPALWRGLQPTAG